MILFPAVEAVMARFVPAFRAARQAGHQPKREDQEAREEWYLLHAASMMPMPANCCPRS